VGAYKLLIVLSFVTILSVIYFFNLDEAPKKSVSEQTNTVVTDKVASDDEQIIRSQKTASEERMHTALVRRSRAKDPFAEEVARDWLGSESIWLKSAALEVLGSKDDFVDILNKNLDSHESLLVKHALLGLGLGTSEKRQKILLDFINTKNSNPELIALATQSLFRSGLDTTDRFYYILNLMDIYDVNSKDVSSDIVLNKIISLAPRNARVLNWMENKIYKLKADPNLHIMIEHFLKVKPEKSENVFYSSKDTSELVNFALIRSSAYNCYRLDMEWATRAMMDQNDQFRQEQSFISLYSLLGPEFTDYFRGISGREGSEDTLSSQLQKAESGQLSFKCNPR
jgi:hypothetical protein